jgi:hypothetical protein
MSNETNAASVDDLIHPALIGPFMQKAVSERANCFGYARQINMIGLASPAMDIPIATSWWGTPTDRGASVDTELNSPGEGVAVGNTKFSTSKVTLTPSEFKVQLTVTDIAAEDSISAIDLYSWISGDMLHAMSLAWESDYVTQYSSLSTSVGTTNTAITLAVMTSALVSLRNNGVMADATAYVMDNYITSSVESLFTATNAAAAIYAMAADRVHAWNPTPDHGMTNRTVAGFRGSPVVTTGMCPTVNSTDVASALICPSTAFNDNQSSTTHFMGIKRLPRLRSDNASATAIGSGTTILVMDSRIGFSEAQDKAGIQILAKNSA